MRDGLPLRAGAGRDGAAAAQNPLPARVTLDEALTRAAANSHRLGELRARESAAGAVLDQRRAADLPIVSAQAGYQRTNHVDEFGFVQNGQLQVLYPDVPDNWRARLDMQWPIYTGGRTKALEQAATAEQQRDGQGSGIGAGRFAPRDDAGILGAGDGDRVGVGGRGICQAHRSAAWRCPRAIRRRLPAAK